jgi:hypothetical protein
MDTTIRPITIGEQAEQAARRFVATGEPEPNPHAGTDQEQRWRSCYERWLLQLTAPDAEASA